jgi:hypothetical protein
MADLSTLPGRSTTLGPSAHSCVGDGAERAARGRASCEAAQGPPASVLCDTRRAAGWATASCRDTVRLAASGLVECLTASHHDAVTLPGWRPRGWWNA